MDSIFKALNNENRRGILELLRQKDLSAGEIADAFHISKPSISHHLDILKRADLVSFEKKDNLLSIHSTQPLLMTSLNGSLL